MSATSQVPLFSDLDAYKTGTPSISRLKVLVAAAEVYDVKWHSTRVQLRDHEGQKNFLEKCWIKLKATSDGKLCEYEVHFHFDNGNSMTRANLKDPSRSGETQRWENRPMLSKVSEWQLHEYCRAKYQAGKGNFVAWPTE
jgi:hypothetical protein